MCRFHSLILSLFVFVMGGCAGEPERDDLPQQVKVFESKVKAARLSIAQLESTQSMFKLVDAQRQIFCAAIDSLVGEPLEFECQGQKTNFGAGLDYNSCLFYLESLKERCQVKVEEAFQCAVAYGRYRFQACESMNRQGNGSRVLSVPAPKECEVLAPCYENNELSW